MSQARIEIELHEQPKYKWHDLRCENCGYKATLAVLKKEKVKEVECPKCDLVTLIEI